MGGPNKGHTLKWTLAICLIFSLILVPFFVFGQAIDSWVVNFLAENRGQRVWAGLVLGGLLASDVVLPIPSSFISTGLGHLLGFVWGTLIGWMGMTAGCMVGYALGRFAASGARKRFLNEEEIAQLVRIHDRFGDWALVILRPVPVLAEASVLCAGLARMPFGKFLGLCLLSNLGISLAYSAVGAITADLRSFLLAFAGAILLPGIAMALARPLKRMGGGPSLEGRLSALSPHRPLLTPLPSFRSPHSVLLIPVQPAPSSHSGSESVIPVKTGIQRTPVGWLLWIPVFTGMTKEERG
jgi:uncharacterized membrane protein YdjX (TVP38/TMEM64 family)